MACLEDIKSVKELSKLFSKSLDRSLFISEYTCFGNDGNNDFYKKFIKEHIYNNRSKAQEDCIELTIVLNYYNENHLLVIKNIMYSRRSELLKLLCLDWVLNFNKCIPLKEFKEVNNIVLKKSDADLIRIQALLNLLFVEWNIDIYDKFKDHLVDVMYGTPYYRVLNFLKENFIDQKNNNEISQDVLLALNSNKNLNEEQKKELLSAFSLIEIR